MELRTGLHQKKEQGPEQELACSSKSSFFCNQVFFVYDPSSSTSLLSSVGISTRKIVKQTAGSCGNFRIDDPKMSLTTPVQGEIEVTPECWWCRQCWWYACDCECVVPAAVPGPGTGAHQTPPSSCDLLQPGVLCLRSIFCNQSSFFGRHLDQALDVNPNPPSAKRNVAYLVAANFVVEKL